MHDTRLEEDFSRFSAMNEGQLQVKLATLSSRMIQSAFPSRIPPQMRNELQSRLEAALTDVLKKWDYDLR